MLALIEQLVESGDYTHRDIAVLYRTHSTARTLYEKLLLSGIPFTTHRDDPTFYELSTIRPVLDFMRLSLDPYNEAALESILPCLYISKARYMKEIQIISIQQGVSYVEALRHLKALPSFQRRRLIEQVDWLHSIARLSPLQAVREIRNEAGGGYDKFLGSEQNGAVTYHKEMLRDDLFELEEAVKAFGTVSEFCRTSIRFLFKKKRARRHSRPVRESRYKRFTAPKAWNIRLSFLLVQSTVYCLIVLQSIRKRSQTSGCIKKAKKKGRGNGRGTSPGLCCSNARDEGAVYQFPSIFPR